jgi:hypothetical protein
LALVFKPVRDACKTWMIAPNVIVGQGLMAHYFFISHSSKHKSLAEAVLRRRTMPSSAAGLHA